MNENLDLYFDAKKHKYTDTWGSPFISQTQIIGVYCEKKDWEAIADACAAIGANDLYADPSHPKHTKYLKYKGKSAYDILVQWKIIKDVACAKGNEKHDYLETTIKDATNFDKSSVGNGKDKVKLFTVEDMIADRKNGFHTDVSKLAFLKARFPLIYQTVINLTKDGWRPYSEVGVFNTQYRVSGQIDLLVYKHPYFIIIDWKTNRAPMRFEAGYFEKDRDGNLILDKFIETGEVFLPPIDYLPASTGNKYALQLSGYTYMTEMFGLKPVKDNYLFHIREIEQRDDDGNIVKVDNKQLYEEVVDTHKIPYMKEEILAIFSHYHKQHANSYVSNSN